MKIEMEDTPNASLSSPNHGWHSRGYLPHFESSVVIQSVTYRLADALPSEVVDRFRQELEGHENDDQELRQRIEAWQDAGHGSCALRAAAHAKIVIEAWQHFDSSRYRLHAWVVMPNHVHLLVQMIPPHSLSDAIESWKRFTATRINQLMARSGRFWQEDYWDRYIRDDNHYRATVAYIHENPVKAGLVGRAEDWPWSSAAY
jgi:putative DNA methylase